MSGDGAAKYQARVEYHRAYREKKAAAEGRTYIPRGPRQVLSPEERRVRHAEYNRKWCAAHPEWVVEKNRRQARKRAEAAGREYRPRSERPKLTDEERRARRKESERKLHAPDPERLDAILADYLASLAEVSP